MDKIKSPSCETEGLFLFLHGYPGASNDWLQLIVSLTSDNKRDYFVAPDMPWIKGVTVSRAAETLTLRALTASICNYIASFNGTPVHIVGHDLGGMIAWWVAITMPKLCRTVTVIGAPHPCAYRDALPALEENGYRDYILSILNGDSHDPLPSPQSLEQDVPTSVAKQIKQSQSSTDPSILRNFYRSNFSKETVFSVPDTPAISVPVLLIHGAKESYFPQEIFQKSEDWAGPFSKCVKIEGASHFLPLTHPTELAGHLKGYWKKNE